MAAAFQTFVKLVGHPVTHADADGPSTSDASSTVSDESDEVRMFPNDTTLLRQLREQHQVAESTYSVRMRDVMPTLEQSTADLRSACSAALGSMKAVLDDINTRRYSRKGPKESDLHIAELDGALDRLRVALEEFKTTRRLQLTGPYESLFSNAKEGQGYLPLRSLYVSFVFAGNLIVLADAVVTLMEYMQLTAHKRRKNRLWAPGSLRALGKALFSKGSEMEQVAGEDSTPEPEEDMKRKEAPFSKVRYSVCGCRCSCSCRARPR